MNAPKQIAPVCGLLVAAGVAAGALAPGRAQRIGTVSPLPQANAGVRAADWGKAPLVFEENRGQAAAGVRFMSRGPGYGLYLTGKETVLSLRRPAPAGKKAETAQLRMKLVGARADATVQSLERAAATVNYYHGKDRTRWQAGVPTYQRVKYAGVYPGVDLVYYGNQQELEYDFVVAPGADPQGIALEFGGQERLSLDNNGDLVLRTAAGEVRQPAPVFYQERNGTREAVEGRWKLQNETRVAFEIGHYDRARALVIDPKLTFSTFLGGRGTDVASGVTLDKDGNAYVVGTTFSDNFPLTADAQQPTFNDAPYSEAFVVKYSAAGAVEYATYLGGNNYDEGNGIAVDSQGQIYLTGSTQAEDFPITADAVQIERDYPWDAWVTRLDTAGQLSYSTLLGGRSDDRGYAVGADENGLIYVAGRTRSDNFPNPAPGKNGFRSTRNSGADDAFLVQLDTTQSGEDQILYATYFGGYIADEAHGMVVRGSQVYLTGFTLASDFPTTPGVVQPVKPGRPKTSDGWAAQFDLSQTGTDSLVWSTYLGGTEGDVANGIAVNGAGNVIVVGTTASRNFPKKLPIPAGLNATFGGGNMDGFISVLNPTGTAFLRSSYLGGRGDDEALGVAADPCNFIYITGRTTSTNFPAKNPLFKARGYDDAFLIKVDQVSYAVQIATYLGGTRSEAGLGVATDECGVNAVVVGTTASVADFPRANAAQPVFGGAFFKKYNDAFVTKIGPLNGPFAVARANNVVDVFTKECTGPLTSFTLTTTGSKDVNNRPLQFRWCLDGVNISSALTVAQSKPVGSYLYTLTATNPLGDSGCDTVLVNIVDTVAPVFTGAGTFCPASIGLTIPLNQNSAVVNLNGPAIARDLCDGLIQAVGTRSDGKALNAAFPVGVTFVTWTATDSSGNSATCSQTVSIAH